MRRQEKGFLPLTQNEQAESYIEWRTKKTWRELASNPDLSCFVDSTLDPPGAFCGSGPIRLIVLGQDPTVKDPSSRARVKTSLNLDRQGSLRRYLIQVCEGLGLDLDQHVYATNYLKNFFVEPPTRIKGTDILDSFGPFWEPILNEELDQFPHIPVVTLGQPLLAALVCKGASPHVRDYWGYVQAWPSGETGSFAYLKADENRLGRLTFPFPHEPSVRKRFYKSRLQDYAAFVKTKLS
jgi:hypothetical protein